MTDTAEQDRLAVVKIQIETQRQREANAAKGIIEQPGPRKPWPMSPASVNSTTITRPFIQPTKGDTFK
jgi:hypothetical protein